MGAGLTVVPERQVPAQVQVRVQSGPGLGTCLFRGTVDSEKSFPTVTKQKECQGVNSDHSSKKGGEDGCQQDSEGGEGRGNGCGGR